MATTGPAAPASNWELRDVFISSRGSKSAALVAAGAPVHFMLNAPGQELTSPWGAGNFGDQTGSSAERRLGAAEAPTRLSLDFSLPPELVAKLEAIDEWTVAYLAQHSERLLKRRLTPEQVRLAYKPLVKPPRDPAYPPTVRVKFSPAGRNALRCWSAQGARVEPPADWRGVPCVCRVCLAHVWFMGPTFGWVLNMTDARVSEPETACPFPETWGDGGARTEGDGAGGGMC